MDRHITVPYDEKTARELKSGDMVYLTGTIYTARDAAHKRMYEAIERGEKLPFDVKNNIIWDRRRPEKGAPLALPVRLQPAEWTDMRRHFWALD